MAYPQKLSRLSTLFRIILAIPVVLFIALLSGGYAQWVTTASGARNVNAGAAGSIVLAIWATVLVKGRIPRWLFDFQVAVQRFTYRAYAYVGLLTDQYPAFEGEWLLNYEVDYPERISRWRLLFWKVITALPHFIVLFFLSLASLFVIFISWWAILFTGQFPRGLHKFVVGVMRWGARVTAYVESLTDVFPPFSLEENAGAGSHSSLVLSAVGGGLLFVGVVGGIAAGAAVIYRISHETKTQHVRYSDVTSAAVGGAGAITLDDITFTLKSGQDPARVDVLKARLGRHLVEFVVDYRNDRQFHPANGSDVDAKTLRLKTAGEGVIDPVLLTVDDVTAPLDVLRGRVTTVRAFFEVKDDDTPVELRGYTLPKGSRHVAWDFR